MQHFHPVKRLQPSGDLLNDPPYSLQIRSWIVDHPLGQSLPVDKFHDDIEVVSLSGLKARLQDMGVIDAPRDPLFHHEPLQIASVATQVDRRDFDDDDIVTLDIDGQINVAAVASVNPAEELIALES